MSDFVLVSRPRVDYLTCPAFPPPHAFTLRTHGFGERERGETDRSLLTETLGLSTTAYMRQVHGDRVLHVSRSDDGEPLEADGLITDAPGIGLVVHSADCVPLLFWDESRNVVAAVHSGWRGTLARVATRAVEALIASHGSDPGHVHVALGPAIRACCFEVGDEVVEAFAESGREMSGLTAPGARGRRHLDLIEDNRRQIQSAGIDPERIHDSRRCTSCENESFYSYRKEGQGVGRVISMIGRAPD